VDEGGIFATGGRGLTAPELEGAAFGVLLTGAAGDDPSSLCKIRGIITGVAFAAFNDGWATRPPPPLRDLSFFGEGGSKEAAAFPFSESGVSTIADVTLSGEWLWPS
jgi:hypothetical protein